MLQMPQVLNAMRRKQARARDILAEGSERLKVPMRAGAGPWTLIKLGSDVGPFVDELASKHKIDVQPQTGALTGWVRISATVPCQAQTIVAAMTEILGRRGTGVLKD